MTFAALSAFAEEFLALRRSAARHDPRQQGVELRYLKHREKLLRGFLLCWRNCGCPWPIPSSLLLDWIAVGADRQHPYRDQHRYYTVRAFLRQVRIIEPATGIPENIYRPLFRRRTPYLFSDSDTARLMDVALRLPFCDALRNITFHTLLGLLASTGMRIGEAIALNLEDVELDTDPPHLLVHESKFGKSRCVVLHSSTVEHLRTYLRERQKILHGRKVAPFFTNRNRGRLSYMSQWMTFRRLLKHAGIQRVPGKRGPSLHCFRHTFAVKRLTLWYREHRDVQKLLPHLAVYLGHLGPENTYWYVSSTPELLDAASADFESRYIVGGTDK
jgi:integrase/recombinase XerD